MAKSQILLAFKQQDTPTGVTRGTVKQMAEATGLNETAIIHLALAKMAQETIPMYEPDDGPLTPEQTKALQQEAHETSRRPVGPPRKIKHLFGR